MIQDIFLTSPIWSLFLFSLIPLTLKLIRGKECLEGLSVGLMGAGVLTSLFLLSFTWPSTAGEVRTIFHSALVLNQHRISAGALLLLSALGVLLISSHHPQVDRGRFSEILFLKMGALQGLMVLLFSGNLLTAFIGLEMASLAFYLLIALGRTGKVGLMASFKYFVLGSVASAIFLYGVSFFIGSVGHFNLAEVLKNNPELLSRSRLLILALVLIIAGMLFKVSVFPFHSWLPDVYQGAWTPLLVFMATGFKVVVFVLLLEWTQNMFVKGGGGGGLLLLSLFQWLAVLSVLFGNIIALLQKDFKRTLLFSTIAHSGYMFMILISGQTGFYEAKQALFYYLILYVCMTLGVFICIRPFEKENLSALNLNHLKGLAYKKPFHAFLISLFLLGLAGIPPTGGFVAKLFLFHSLLEQGFWWMLFWTIAGSSIALFYYLKPIALMYNMSPVPLPDSLQGAKKRDTIEEGPKVELKTPPVVVRLCKWALGLLVLLSGLVPGLFQFL